MTVVIQEVTGHELINELIYRGYKYNRQRWPDIPVKDWRCVFANAEAMERRL
jgi:hypothetical protein